jgi:hypothetical protein
MEATILRRECYKQLQSGEPFDMVFITADRRRKSGGEIVNARGWLVCSAASDEPRAVSEKLRASSCELREEQPDAKDPKDPHHKEHGTINIFNPANSGIHPITVHFDLIQFFNSKRVIN